VTDAAFMLAVLEERPGEWVSQAELLARSQRERGCGLTVHSRAATLRDLGHNVECQVVRGWDRYQQKHVGRAVSYYRWLAPLAQAEAPSLPSTPPLGASAGASVGEPSASLRFPTDVRQPNEAPESAVAASPALTLFEMAEKPAWS
jgi:hypothetical protein